MNSAISSAWSGIDTTLYFALTAATEKAANPSVGLAG
jgi:hypothetical protein